MPPKGHGHHEDDEPKTFEQILVYEKVDDIDEYDPVGVLYRDPRVEENGGFKAEKGYIIDFKPTSESDEIILMSSQNKEARITRRGPKQYKADDQHDVYCYPKVIYCSKKAPGTKRRRNHHNGRGGYYSKNT